ncbi:olfactory receptor 7C1-like [Suncus etruscus]|uniref:olfactory receptor 7C1-like n=1 Tax=Suncus etruscus TaxID=109475 RepID=UPI00210FD707|nr:olfactory receptor 7C1-like [Suncus etruscus]
MAPGNQSSISGFFLLGFSQNSEHQVLLFGMFLCMYLTTVLGNLLIVLAVSFDPHLHTPMYFFLSHLSLMDICFVSTTVPKMLMNIQTQSRAISYAVCVTQVFFFSVFGGMDTLLLTVMAYDRFVAICHPLHYTVIMNALLCALLVIVSWLVSLSYSLLESLLMLHLSFCRRWVIPHFYCELVQVLELACSDTTINHVIVYAVSGLLGIAPLSGIFFSYTRIISSILRIPSEDGKHKAFSTCASHLTVVALFYGTGLGVYLSSEVSTQRNLISSVMYTVVTPMLNPFIYSLRNRDIKRALQRVVLKTFLVA